MAATEFHSVILVYSNSFSDNRQYYHV